jgi:hypothetical protein
MAESIQLRKNYGNDSAKSKSRELVRSLINRSLLKFRKPCELKVLCFPGVDAIEIYKVYDSLNIPRRNIIGLEREKEIAKKIQEKDLGIQLIPTSLEGYVDSQDKFNFDIISLDFTGPINVKQTNTLEKLLAKQQKNHFVLHNANLIKRDKSSYDLYRFGINQNFPKEKCSLSKSLEIENIINLNKVINQQQTDLLNGNSKDIKLENYTNILKTIIEGAQISDLETLFKFSCYEEHLKKDISFLELIINTNKLPGTKDISIDLKSPVNSLILQTGNRLDINKIVQSLIVESLSTRLMEVNSLSKINYNT